MATAAGHADALRVANARGSRLRVLVGARWSILSLLAGALLWETAGRLLHLSFLPPLSNVLRVLVRLTAGGQIASHLARSLAALAIGYALAAALGIMLGILMGRYRKVEYALDLYLHIFIAAPKIALVPVLFALFGAGHTVQVAVVFLSAFFVIVVNTMSAIRTVDPIYVEMALSFGARESQLFWRVLLPGALPLTMAGLRIGLGRAVKGMINGEMLIAVFGLGGLLRTYGARFDSEGVFAIVLLVIAVALACTGLVEAAERRLTRWTEA